MVIKIAVTLSIVSMCLMAMHTITYEATAHGPQRPAKQWSEHLCAEALNTLMLIVLFLLSRGRLLC